ncbi:MAG: hypothetical protein QOH63_1638 [Acidobacteriota bacterium]|jgi:hypothetical protein|nr:hypothetical protein [Acidobacteriota bacterium]MDT5061179.1 hypothetical protein [Acidobacteriota bacterium]
MKTVIKAIGLTVSVWALLLSSAQHSRGVVTAGHSEAATLAGLQYPYEEINAYFDGAKWVSGGTQCDGSREVTIVKPVGKSNNIRVTAFQKSAPVQKTELTLKQKGEPDCGMMKCFSTYVAPGSGQRYVIMDSNYRDDESYWIHTVWIGKGKAAEDNMDECRWLERARVALITDLRSIYVTQDESGGFEYKSFNFKGASTEPSTTVKNGKHELDSAKGIESFTFTNGEFTYVVNVSTSEKRPFAEVLVKKNGETVQKEHCLVYSYSKKSS